MGKTLRWVASTLVTLLLLAIIGGFILAIAMPDLFKTQMDDKVQRMKGDQRGLATAIESYKPGAGEPPPEAPKGDLPKPAEPNPFAK